MSSLISISVEEGVKFERHEIQPYKCQLSQS